MLTIPSKRWRFDAFLRIMSLQLEKIFLGSVPSNQRKFATKLFKHLVNNYPILISPTCGQFGLVKCAIEAGYKPENIYASDISLFSSLLGYYYSGKSIWEIDFILKDKYFKKIKKFKTEVEQIAYIMLLMKIHQLNDKIMYEKNIIDELKNNEKHHLKFLVKKLKEAKKYYDGINYSIEDMRDIFEKEYSEKTIIALDPPIFSKGYEKMFNFKDFLEYNSGIEEFDLKKEYKNLYELSLKNKNPFLWYKYKDTKGYNSKEVVYAEEHNNERFDYWLFTKPELLEGFKEKGLIDFKKGKSLKKSKYPLFTDNDEITENTKISFVKVEEEQALYYRDLWCHRLGNSKAETYFLGLLDGKIFATVGFLHSELFRLKSDRVFQMFGFTPGNKKYKQLNRLLLLAITCEEMKAILVNNSSRVNRVYDLKGLKTTAFSRYRKTKINSGILKVIKSEALKEGGYKLMYDTDFHKINFKQCVKIFLKECKSGSKEDLFKIDNNILNNKNYEI